MADSPQTALQDFKAQFEGDIITPNDDAYKTRAMTLQQKDSPAIILKPKTTKAVTQAVVYAAQSGKTLSVRSGGHSMAGFSTNNQGVVIDLANLNTVQIIDADKNIVRVGSGAVWGDVAKTLALHNLVITAGDTKSVGVGGLTLGGGVGWMSRKNGLAIDNLIGAEIVTASGDILELSAQKNPDLFWAIRGGGGGFGVVTYFDFVAQPSTGTVYAGNIMVDISQLQSSLMQWRDFMRTASPNITSVVRLMPPMGPGRDAAAIIQVCYDGPADQAASELAPLTQIQGALTNDLTEIAYNDFLEEGRQPRTKAIVRSSFVDTLTDEIIASVAEISCKPGSMMVQVRGLGGVLASIPNDATAFGFRKSEALIAGIGFMFSDDVSNLTNAWDKIAQYQIGSYINFSSNATEDPIHLYPPATLERLRSVKKQYDPNNLFSQNFAL